MLRLVWALASFEGIMLAIHQTALKEAFHLKYYILQSYVLPIFYWVFISRSFFHLPLASKGNFVAGLRQIKTDSNRRGLFLLMKSVNAAVRKLWIPGRTVEILFIQTAHFNPDSRQRSGEMPGHTGYNNRALRKGPGWPRRGAASWRQGRREFLLFTPSWR